MNLVKPIYSWAKEHKKTTTALSLVIVYGIFSLGYVIAEKEVPVPIETKELTTAAVTAQTPPPVAATNSEPQPLHIASTSAPPTTATNVAKSEAERLKAIELETDKKIKELQRCNAVAETKYAQYQTDRDEFGARTHAVVDGIYNDTRYSIEQADAIVREAYRLHNQGMDIVYAEYNNSSTWQGCPVQRIGTPYKYPL